MLPGISLPVSDEAHIGAFGALGALGALNEEESFDEMIDEVLE